LYASLSKHDWCACLPTCAGTPAGKAFGPFMNLEKVALQTLRSTKKDPLTTVYALEFF
jgi:hypothetical protein